MCERRIVPIGDDSSEPGAKLRIEYRDRVIHRNAMTADIGCIMRQRAQCEGVLIDVLRFVYQRRDEITGSDIVCQIAEKLVGERIITHVLNDAPAISVGVGFLQR